MKFYSLRAFGALTGQGVERRPRLEVDTPSMEYPCAADEMIFPQNRMKKIKFARRQCC